MSYSKTSLKKATLINSAAKYYNVICAFIVNMILSRILTPEEYGVVAVATVFITFFSLFSDLGFGMAYIQNKSLNVKDRDCLFTFLVYVGVLLFVIFFFFAYLIARFYEDNIYIKVTQLLGLNLFLTAVNVIPNAELLKRQRFKTVGLTQVVASTVSSACAVISAKLGFSYYSIVLQTLINTLIVEIVFISITKTKFVFKVNISSVKKVLGFSTGQILFNIINYFSRNLDNLLIGKIFGNVALGYYDKAYKTSTYVVSNFSSIIGNSIQPVLSDYQDNYSLIYDKFKKIFLFLVVVGAYLSISLSLSSREIIIILYGNQWEESIPAFSFLALSLFAQMSLNITGAFYQVLNKTKLLAFAGTISAILIVSGISSGLIIGSIEAVAKGYFIAQCINFITILWIMGHKLFCGSITDLVIEVIKIAIVFTITYFISKTFYGILSIKNIIGYLVIKLFFAGVIFLILLYIFHLEKYLLTIIFPTYKRR